MKEYRVVYKNGNYVLELGQNGWLPTKEIAERIKKHKLSDPWNKNTKAYIEERENPNPKDRKPCRTHEGKTVYNQDWLWMDALLVGDYVEEEVVDNFMNMLPPTCMRSDCCQVGEAHSHKVDEKTGKTRATYATFKRVDNETWEYCGYCFMSENIERGKELPYV